METAKNKGSADICRFLRIFITIADGKMNWTALRQNEDGSTFTATFEMKKVD